MATTDQSLADAQTSHPDTELALEEEAEQQQSQRAYAGLWVILGVIAVVLVGTFLAISHRAHTPALSPGKPQTPSAVAMLGGAS